MQQGRFISWRGWRKLLANPAGSGVLLSRLWLRFGLLAMLLGSATSLQARFDLGEYAIEDFANLPTIRELELSANGTYFSAMITVAGTPALAIENLEVDTKPYLVRGADWSFNWHEWLDDERLITSVGLTSRIQGTPVKVTRLVLVDAKKREMKLLFERERGNGFFQVQDRYLGQVPGEPDRILISGNPHSVEKRAVYLAKLSRAPLPKRTYQRPIANVRNWRADKLGNVRVGIGYSRDQRSAVMMLRDAQGDWHDFSDFLNGEMEVMALPTDDLDSLYVQVPTDGEFREVRRLHVPSRQLHEVIAAHPNSDVSFVRLNIQGDDIAIIGYDSEEVPNEYRHPQLARLKGIVDKAFPDSTSYVAAVAEDESKAIIGAISDTLPRHYFLYDQKKKTIDYLTSTYRSLMENAPGRVHDVTFAARDGLQIPGYITLPRDIALADARKLPFVVHPHGGPAARDFRTFDWMTQMMTAAGYGVLQINFRGSTGYGMAFQKAGRKQWGQAMQDDVTDGTHWLIDQGIADPERICIFGASYGGYAALMGAAKEPGLYRCAVSLNGVTDLPGLIRHQMAYIGGRFATRFIGRLWKDRDVLKTNSPLHQADNITVPVLLVHGEKDLRVPVAQSRRMHRALADHLVTYVELPEGNHHLAKTDNRLHFATTLLTHLHQNIGSDLGSDLGSDPGLD